MPRPSREFFHEKNLISGWVKGEWWGGLDHIMAIFHRPPSGTPSTARMGTLHWGYSETIPTIVWDYWIPSPYGSNPIKSPMRMMGRKNNSLRTTTPSYLVYFAGGYWWGRRKRSSPSLCDLLPPPHHSSDWRTLHFFQSSEDLKKNKSCSSFSIFCGFFIS